MLKKTNLEREFLEESMNVVKKVIFKKKQKNLTSFDIQVMFPNVKSETVEEKLGLFFTMAVFNVESIKNH